MQNIYCSSIKWFKLFYKIKNLVNITIRLCDKMYNKHKSILYLVLCSCPKYVIVYAPYSNSQKFKIQSTLVPSTLLMAHLAHVLWI
jgi:hypothetical protein